MKILLTGSAGFIGYHVAKKMLGNGYKIFGLDNLNDYYDVNLKKARLANYIGFYNYTGRPRKIIVLSYYFKNISEFFTKAF